MSTIREVQDQARALRARCAALETQLERGGGERVRLELALCREELVDCGRRLRALRPRHHIRHGGTTWSGPQDCRIDGVRYSAWLESRQEAGPSLTAQLAEDTRRAMGRLPDRQRCYLAGAAQGENTVSLARQYDRDPSTIARTLRRAKERVKQAAELCALGRRWSSQEEVLRLDLARRDQLALLAERLTERQQLYLYLYYGEWMSLREIGQLLEVDKSTVLRTIRRGLERLDGLFQVQQVQLDNVGRLEGLLIELYETLTEQDLAAQHNLRRVRTGGPGGGPRTPSGPSEAAQMDTLREEQVTAYGSTGRLLAWLEERKKETTGLWGWMQKTLLAAVRKLNAVLHLPAAGRAANTGKKEPIYADHH